MIWPNLNPGRSIAYPAPGSSLDQKFPENRQIVYHNCVLTSVHPPFDDRIFHKEATTLVKAGYNVALIAQHEKDEIVDGIRIVSLPKPKNRFRRMTKVACRLFRLAIRENGMVKPCQWGSYIIGSIRNHDFEYFRKKGIEYNKEFVQKRIPKSCLFCERVMQCHGGCLLINDTVRCPLRYNGGSYNIRRFYGNSAISRFKVGLKRLGRIGFSGC